MPYFHIALKEIKELLRDKKNLVLNILFPLIIIIVIGSISGISGAVIKNKNQNEKITLAVNSVSLKNMLKGLPDSYTIVEKSKDDIVKEVKVNNFKLGVIWDDSNQNITFIENESNKDDPYIKIIKDNIVRVTRLAITPNINLANVHIDSIVVKKDYSTIVLKSIATICAYVIMLLVMRINNSNAYYLTTKEKLSGTLEILLISPVKSFQIVLGKWISNFASCYLITIAIFLPLYTGFALLFQVFLKVDINLFSKIPILALVLFGFAIVFSLFQLLLGFASKSSKQAQVFLVYVPLLLVIPLTLVFASDLRALNIYSKVIYWLDFIPIINFYDLIQMSIFSIFSLKKVLLIIMTNIFIVSIFVVSLVRIFNNERILFFKN
ncbi:ABC-2 family transporter protein [Clostridium tepidiprofundi DSM 19306]|uniref:ABC-2 family transporter protein n=1 Tax=Clostridium tepidiprofundi DSM 19306 TaxID=1121338 RepID=A0A151B5X6_9CLOT|nr:ABC transporter permease [Clostridium tepidiprofundi]KYH35269.1 ABC-2 family transporter protein [Clostridium tepidiprofundi DSM 19306]